MIHYYKVYGIYLYIYRRIRLYERLIVVDLSTGGGSIHVKTEKMQIEYPSSGAGAGDIHAYTDHTATGLFSVPIKKTVYPIMPPYRKRERGE